MHTLVLSPGDGRCGEGGPGGSKNRFEVVTLQNLIINL